MAKKQKKYSNVSKLDFSELCDLMYLDRLYCQGMFEPDGFRLIQSMACLLDLKGKSNVWLKL